VVRPKSAFVAVTIAAQAFFGLTLAHAERAQLIRADQEIYDQTIEICSKQTEIYTPSLIGFFLSTEINPLDFQGPPKHKVRIRRPDITAQSFREFASEFSIQPTLYVRILLNNDGFFQALEQCFPDGRFEGAKQLRAQFIVEIMRLDVEGKLWGLNSLAASAFLGGGLLKAVRVLSPRAYKYVAGTLTAATAVAIVSPVVISYFQHQSMESLFPRWARANSEGWSRERVGQAAVQDFLAFSYEVKKDRDVAFEVSRNTIDALIAQLTADLENKMTDEARNETQEKIKALRAARMGLVQ